MKYMRKQKPSRAPIGLRVLFVLLLIGGASFGLACVWQNAQDALTVEEPPPQERALEAAVQAADTWAAEPSADEPAQEPGQPDEGSPDIPDSEASGAESEAPESSEAELDGKRPAAAAAVPESPRKDNSYFEDAIFFGDSLSTGIPLYNVAGNPDTVAFTGITPESINTAQEFVTPDGKKTALEAAKRFGEKKKVYIMLGANGLWMDEDPFVKGYQTFIDAVKAQYPDAVIYLQSILPVTEDAYLTYETADNDVIERFNVLIQKLAADNSVYYLDIAHALMDETGALPKEASPHDGMHLTAEYYNKWFQYLRTHTVEVS